MRAAVVREYGIPQADDFEEPQAGSGQAVIEVLAAGLNPVDVAICQGAFYAGRPPLPFVGGREGIGLLDGRRMYFDAPVLPFGSMAERALIDPHSTYEVPDGVNDGVAVALGISGMTAWLALTWRAQLQPGEHVLVLAASGVLGQIAVQAAKLLGAGRVVAAARSPEGLERCLELGADAAVRLDGSDELPAAFTDAADGTIDVVVDPLFGEPFQAAAEAAELRREGRAARRGRGRRRHAGIGDDPREAARDHGPHLLRRAAEIKREAYRRLSEAAAAGELRVESEPIALEQVARPGSAWPRRAPKDSARAMRRLPGY